MLGDEHYDTVTTMERLAELYRRQGKYEQAQTLLTEALRARRRALGPQNPDTIEDLSMLGLVHLQQQKYAEVESLLQELVVPSDKAAPDTWFRYLGHSIVGAALSAEKKYAEAERLLIDGYQGMTDRVATIPADSRPALGRAGEWIVELYQSWGKPERADEWSQRLQQTTKVK